MSLNCHHHNDFCIKMGSGESHFNVSLIVRVKVTRQFPQTTTFEEKEEPKRIRTEVLLLTSLTPFRWAKLAHKGIERSPLWRCIVLHYIALCSIARLQSLTITCIA